MNVKFQNILNKEIILKTSREKKQATFKELGIVERLVEKWC